MKNLPTNISVKNSYKFLLIIVILFIITIVTLNSDVLHVYIENEYFTNLRNYFLFNNYNKYDINCNYNCQSRLLNLQHSLGRNTNLKTSRYPDTNYINNINNISLNLPIKLDYLDTKALGYINRLVQIKHDDMCLISNNNKLEFRNVKLNTKGYEASCFKVVLGLVDPKCISLYHIASDRFICRKPDGTLFLANFELVDCKSRHAFSFKLCKGIVNGNKVIITCPRINLEQEGRILKLSENGLNIKLPLMVKLNDINNKIDSEFQFVDCHSGVVLGTKYEGLDIEQINSNIDREIQRNGLEYDEQVPFGLHLPKFFNNSVNNYASTKEGFTSGTQVSKSKLREMVASFVNQGLITNNEINPNEIFGSNSNNHNLFKDYSSHTHHQREAFQNGDDDAVDANVENNVPSRLEPNDVFDVIKGKNIEKILTMDIVGKNYAEILSDSLMEKLQKAKLDPEVQNLLDYNEKLYNVYRSENDEYMNKLEEHKNEHLANVDNRIKQANNYRVSQMARDLFNMEDILKDKQNVLNNSI